jgi:hypothetical protein
MYKEYWEKAMQNRQGNPVNEGPSIRGHRVQHIEALSILVIDGVAIEFTRTEYRLVMRLLRQVENLQKHMEEAVEIYVSYEELRQSASLNNRTLLAKHIYNASAKLWAAGMSITRVDRYGYSIVFEMEEDASRFLKQATTRQHTSSHDEPQLFVVVG